MSNDINKRIERIREFFKKTQPQNHPITGHPVARCDEYVKGLYFDMLCVMAMYENDDTENQNRFIGRLMAGSGDTLSITDHIKRAMEITPDKVNELIVQVKIGKLAEILFIDSLIISCANGLPCRKQTEFLAELADMLGLNKAAVSYLCGLAGAILEQDLLIKKCDVKGLDAKNISASVDCYIRRIVENGSFVNTDISLDPKTVHYYSTKINKKALFDKERELKNYDSVTAENITFNSKVQFTSIQKVRLVGCVFENITGSPALYFDGVKEVRFEKCIFRNLRRVMSFASSDTKVTVTDCSFEDCTYPADGSVIIASSNSTPIEFKACVFKNIRIGMHTNFGVISTGNSITARDCKFYNCDGNVEAWDYYLFLGVNYKESNNTYSDCAGIKY